MTDPSSHRDSDEERSGLHWSLPGRPPADLDALLDRLGKWAGRATGGWLGDAQWTPAAEENETPDSYRVRLELPGIPRDLVSIELEGHQLHVHGELASAAESQGSYLGSRAGRFEYRTALPADADPEAIRADLAAGILTVTVPRVTQQERRTIRIEETEDPAA